MYQYGYFFGSLIIGCVWLIVFLSRKDLRKEMFFGGLITIPFGMTELFFVPEYWNPPSILDLINKIGFGIESILFSLFVGGLGAVIYEFVAREKLVKLKRNHGVHWLPYIAVAVIYLMLEILMPGLSIFNLTLSLVIGACMIAFLRKDLIRQVVFSGFYFAVLYFLMFFIFISIFKGYVENVYNIKNLLGISIAGVPLEEILFAFGVGTCWATMYEYVFGYKEKAVVRA